MPPKTESGIINNSRAIIRKKIIRIVLPSLLTIVLFIIAMFGVALPTFKSALMDQKRTMLSAVVDTAEHILIHYEEQARLGAIPLKTAQEMASHHIGELRYGAEKKDYLWINDMQPRMIMHPYRRDLQGQDLSGFADLQGKLLFVEMVNIARKNGQGYTNYLWQWKDDANRIVPKLSYVKLFEPWGWVIGTGVYLEDVRDEVAKLSREMIYISAGILLLMIGLTFYITRRSLNEQTRREAAEAELNRYRENLEELVEKRTAELQNALSQVRILSGFLPICSSCKKIRDDKGYWNQIETYIRDHSEAEFTHGICPQCAKELYGFEQGQKEF